MANDREVLRIVWEGQIPVCFQADPEEIDGLQQPENFFLMISRLSYLPLVTEKVNTSCAVHTAIPFLLNNSCIYIGRFESIS